MQPEDKIEEHEDSLRRIKTYKEDVAEAIQKDNVSVVKMALAENRRREQSKQLEEDRSPQSPKNIILILVSLLLILIGAGVVVYFYYSSKNKPTSVVATPVVTDVISYEYSKDINLTNATKQGVFNAIGNEVNTSLPLGTVEKLVFVASSSEVSGVLTFQDFMNAIDSEIPGALVRSLNPQFFFGLHS